MNEHFSREEAVGMIRKLLSLAIVFCLCSSVGACAQDVTLNHDEIQSILGSMTSTDWQTRSRAFYRLLALGLEGDPHGKTHLFASALKTLAVQSPQDTSKVEMGLIGLLEQENAAIRVFERTNRTMSEAQSDYYGDVIAAVTTLKSTASVDALLGAVNTGGMATRTLAGFGPIALGPLISRLNDPDFSVRSGVVTALSQMVADGNRQNLDTASLLKVEQALFRAASDSEVGVRLSAVTGLAEFSDQRARAALEKLADSDPTFFPGEGEDGKDLYPVRNAATRALAKMSTYPESAPKKAD